MATVNIRRDVTDPFYRYKMEKIQSKIEGKGNGIKTVIVNLTSVAHSLAREPGHIIKYFGFELGAQTNTNPADDRWIINGAHEAAKLQDHLDGFITKFVLCKKCKNPETDPTFPEGRIVLKCKACGERTDVDLRLKLSSFILKNIPKKGKKDKATKKAERKARKERETNGNDDGSNGGSPNDSNSDHADDNGEIEIEANSDDELTRRINSEAKQIEVEEDAEVEWQPAIDTSEAAVKARALDLPEEINRLALVTAEDEDEEGGSKDSVKKNCAKLRRWIVDEAKSKGGVDKVSGEDILTKAKELEVHESHKTLEVLAQTIFDDKIVKQIEKRSDVLSQLINPPIPSLKDRQQSAKELKKELLKEKERKERRQKALLTGTEAFVGKERPELMNYIVAIMVEYHNNDLVSEEVATAWINKSSKNSTHMKVRNTAKPFLKWLEEADEETSEEEDSEEEDEKERKAQ